MFESTYNGLDPATKAILDGFMNANPELASTIRVECTMEVIALRGFLCGLDSSTNEAAYVQHCQRFMFKGTGVDRKDLPANLLRVVNRDGFARRLRLAAQEGPLDDDLSLLRKFETFGDEDRRAILQQLTLGRPGHAVFATFTFNSDLLSDLRFNATDIRNALGLDEVGYLVVLRYPTSEVADTRVPTVADAAGYRFFRPKPADAEFGWTLNLARMTQVPRRAGEAASPVGSLPELVHRNRNAEVLIDRAAIIVLNAPAGPLPQI